jgi:cytoskeletal protein RodZ
MRRQGGGFGFVVMLIVLVVIFYIAMNNFKSVAPTAMEIQKHNKSRKAGQEVQPENFEPKSTSTSASADSWTPAPPSRPSLSTMDQRTSDHSATVKDALSQAN